MKKNINAILAVSAVLLCSCTKQAAEQPVDVTGQWNLADAQLTLKSTYVGEEEVDIYIDFKSDGTFELFQMMGRGRFYAYDGKWQVKGNVLSGIYNDPKKPSGRVWGNTYTVSVGDGLLTMTTKNISSDIYTYKSCTIPEEVRQQALR